MTCVATPQAGLSLFGCNVPLTPEIEAILATYGPSGNNLLTTILNRNAPSDQNGCGWCFNNWMPMIAARGIIYCSEAQGTVCSGGQATQGVPSAGTSALASGTGVALSAIGSVIPGAGLLLGPLESLIQAHTVAVTKEDNTVCAVANAANTTIPAIDAAVAQGTISPSQGIAAMQSLVSSLKTSLGGILKGCNAACCYIALLNCHLDFANTFYQDISPMRSVTGVPGAVQTAPAAASALAAIVQAANPPPGSATVGGIAASSSTFTVIAIGAVGIIILAVVLFKKG